MPVRCLFLLFRATRFLLPSPLGLSSLLLLLLLLLVLLLALSSIQFVLFSIHSGLRLRGPFAGTAAAGAGATSAASSGHGLLRLRGGLMVMVVVVARATCARYRCSSFIEVFF